MEGKDNHGVSASKHSAFSFLNIPSALKKNKEREREIRNVCAGRSDLQS